MFLVCFLFVCVFVIALSSCYSRPDSHDRDHDCILSPKALYDWSLFPIRYLGFEDPVGPYHSHLYSPVSTKYRRTL